MPNSAVLDRIVVAPEDSMRGQIARAFCDGMQERFVWPILPDDISEVESLISSSLEMSDVYAGLDSSGSLLAFAFVTDRPGEVLCLEEGWMRRTWGAWGCFWRTLLLHAVHVGQNRRRALRLEAFVVCPEWRGKGIGAQLMGRILADARAAGRPCVTIDVEEGNFEARHLYEQLGFRVTRTIWVPRRERPGLRSVLAMQLDL